MALVSGPTLIPDCSANAAMCASTRALYSSFVSGCIAESFVRCKFVQSRIYDNKLTPLYGEATERTRWDVNNLYAISP